MRMAALTHPKTKQLARRLGIKLPQTIGHLELLWAFVAQQTPRGDVGRWDNGVIADEAQWEGDPDEFINALIECRYLDESEEHRLLVHDWSEHMPSWVRAKLKNTKQEAIGPTIAATKEAPLEPTTRVGKGSVGKGSEKKGASALAKPDYLQADVWDDFIAFRKQTKFPLTPSAWKSIDRELRAGIDKLHDPNVMLAEAMAAGWRGFRLDWYENRIRTNAPRGGLGVLE